MLEVLTVAMLRLTILESRARPCHPTGEMICLEGLNAALETDIAVLSGVVSEVKGRRATEEVRTNN
jgi:hypothetical protein